MRAVSRKHPIVRAPLALGVLLGLALLAIPGSLAVASSAAAGFLQPSGGTQTSEGGQVTVSVTWLESTDGLVFAVVLDTHAVDLDRYDLGQLAVLRTPAGVEVSPSGWDAPPGGHHREGTLTFPTRDADGNTLIDADARSFEIAIHDVAGVPERIFRWES